MADLTLTGTSDDGKRLLLTDDAGVEHTLAIDARLRSAVRPSGAADSPRSPRSPRLEKKMDSALRPRDIQARIRAGETAESVAEAAATSVDKIMAFAGPVLAERAHVAERAQRSTLRRRAGETGEGVSGRLLGDTVAARLRAENVDPDTVEWDAWRREDGRWTLVADYTAGPRAGVAEFTYDAPGNYVLLDNDDARWLVGETTPASAAPARDDLESARARRLAAVPGDQRADARVDEPAPEPALGDDAIGMVTPDDADDEQPALIPPVERAPEPEPAAAAEAHDDEPAAEEPPARRPVQKKKGRASVPSWDEIMFGGGDQ